MLGHGHFLELLSHTQTMVAQAQDYQNIFHWAETQKDGEVPSFKLRKNDPYTVRISLSSSSQQLTSPSINPDLETRMYSQKPHQKNQLTSAIQLRIRGNPGNNPSWTKQPPPGAIRPLR